MSNVGILWFAGGAYLKGRNSKYGAGHAIVTSFDVMQAVPLSSARSVQQAELCALTQACTSARN